MRRNAPSRPLRSSAGEPAGATLIAESAAFKVYDPDPILPTPRLVPGTQPTTPPQVSDPNFPPSLEHRSPSICRANLGPSPSPCPSRPSPSRLPPQSAPWLLKRIGQTGVLVPYAKPGGLMGPSSRLSHPPPLWGHPRVAHRQPPSREASCRTSEEDPSLRALFPSPPFCLPLCCACSPCVHLLSGCLPLPLSLPLSLLPQVRNMFPGRRIARRLGALLLGKDVKIFRNWPVTHPRCTCLCCSIRVHDCPNPQGHFARVTNGVLVYVVPPIVVAYTLR